MKNIETIDTLRGRIAYEKGRTGYPEGFPAIPDLPAQRYVSPEFYQLELDHLWQKSWLYAAHKDQFPEIGSYVAFEGVPGMPIIVVRTDDGFAAFYNTCPHRGGCLVTEKLAAGDLKAHPSGSIRDDFCLHRKRGLIRQHQRLDQGQIFDGKWD